MDEGSSYGKLMIDCLWIKVKEARLTWFGLLQRGINCEYTYCTSMCRRMLRLELLDRRKTKELFIDLAKELVGVIVVRAIETDTFY